MDLPEKLRQSDTTLEIKPVGEFIVPTVPVEVASAGVRTVQSIPTIPSGTPIAPAKEVTSVAAAPTTLVEKAVKYGITDSITWLRKKDEFQKTKESKKAA